MDSLLLGPGWSSGANALTGSIPPEIGELVRLMKLDLGHNDLSGRIPSELGNLRRLVFLQLDYNQLSGKIPRELGKLNRLKWLVACSNELSGPIPSEIGRLRALERMYLCSNRLDGDLPSEIGDLGKLVHINLGVNRLSGEFPESMLSLKRLTELFWRGNSGLCAPKTQEFKDWLDGIPKSSDIYCDDDTHMGGPTMPEATEPGSCSVTLVAAQSVSGSGPPARGVGRGGGGRRPRGHGSPGVAGTWAVPCGPMG